MSLKYRNSPSKKLCRSSISSLNSTEPGLNLSIKEFWLIVHYPHSDPGKEFEILSQKDLECDSWETLEKGASVTVKYGNAKVQADVVAVSDDSNFLERDFDTITEEFSMEYMRQRRNKKPVQRHYGLGKSMGEPPFVQTHIIKVTDKETQTESNTDISDIELRYMIIKKKYNELKEKYDQFTSFITDVKQNLGDVITKLEDAEMKTDKPVDKNNTPIKNTQQENIEVDEISTVATVGIEKSKEMVSIGPGGTKMPRKTLEAIDWTNYMTATRTILASVNTRAVAAAHSLTRKSSRSSSSNDHKKKKKLDQTITNDIVNLVCKNCQVSEFLVRGVIANRCADLNRLQNRSRKEIVLKGSKRVRLVV